MSIEHFDTPHFRQIAIWILRILSAELAGHLFYKDRSYADVDVARFLGLPLQPNPEARSRQPRQLIEMREKLEAAGDFYLAEETARNLMLFAGLFELNPTETEILRFFVLCETESVPEDCMGFAWRQLAIKPGRFLQHVLGLEIRQVEEAIGNGSKLMRSGILKQASPLPRKISRMTFFSDDVAHSLVSEPYNAARILTSMGVDACPEPILALEDFPHLEPDLALLLPYLKHVVDKGKPGVNILLHGVPGTGKTQLTRIIARELGLPAYEFAMSDRDGDPIPAETRLGAVRAGETFFGQTPALLVFDESEDILTPTEGDRGPANSHKGWFNRLLESNRRPIFWLSNSIRHLDPAFTRRFDFIIEVPVPPRSQRVRILKARVGRQLSDRMIEKLSQAEHVAPAVVARTTEIFSAISASLPKTSWDEAFGRIAGSVLKAQGHRNPIGPECGTLPLDVYDVSCINTDADLTGIALMLRQHPNARICLHGPPGTGKTAFGHWLAREIGRPLQIERAADLLSPFVGGTEQQIATVFNKALSDESVLMIDEVDSFLMDRAQATRSWEVTQVNEMLTRIETFNGVLIASTNRLERLDPASLRRFDMKLHFAYLRPQQSCDLLAAWCRNLAIGPPAAQHLAMIEAVGNVTPGDFAAAARRHRFHPFTDAGTFVRALIEDCEMKTERVRTIGFNPS